MAAVTRRQYRGAAAQTTITNALASGDTSATLAATTGWPSTAAVPFFVVISPGTANEEKCRATISGSVLTLTRAQDNTTAQSHASGATIYPVFTALDADEANQFTSTMTARGDLLTMNSSVDPTRLALGAKGAVLVTDGSDPKWQAVGSNGTVLMADSGQTNGVVWTEQSLGYRNVVINGAMQVAQRGTSTASITTESLYTADRWRTVISSLGTWTQTVENDAPTGSGFRKSLKMNCTTADASPSANDYLTIATKLEGQNVQQFLKGTASAKQFSLSFWVKSNVTGTYIAELIDNDNTRRVSASYSVSASATWEKKTITFPADTTGVLDNDNAASLDVNFWLGAGSTFTGGSPLQTTWGTATNTRATGQTNLAAATNNYWQITGVQLEAGSVATPFEFEDYGTTLAKCQRYYQRWSASSAYSVFTTGLCFSSTQTYLYVQTVQQMRVAPTALDVAGATRVVQWNTTTLNAVALTGLTLGTENTNSTAILQGTVASGLSQGFPVELSANNNASTYIGLSAEL